MLLRALLLLVLVTAASLALTYALGEKVLIALGLILLQIQIIGKKLVSLELPAILAWLKAQAVLFFRIELLKKWVMTTLLPLLMGSALRRRLEGVILTAKAEIGARYSAMMQWYGGLGLAERIVAALIVLIGTFALSVSSLGLWLVLFSVKLPFWLIAVGTTLGKSLTSTVSKMVFRTVAFFNLGLLWAMLRRGLSEDLLRRKHRFEFRVARIVVRQRRLTLRQLEAQKHSVALRWALFREGLRQLWRGRDAG